MSVQVRDATKRPELGSIALGRIGRVVGTIAALQGVMGTYREARMWWDARHNFTLVVDSTDPIWPLLMTRLFDLMEISNRRVISVRSQPLRPTVRSDIDTVEESVRPSKSPALHLSQGGDEPQWVRLEGHRVRVTIKNPDMDSISKSGGQGSSLFSQKATMVANSPAGRDAVERFLDRVARDHHAGKNPPSTWLANRWGNWNRKTSIPQRGFDSIVLPEGQAEGLCADLDQFLAARPAYEALSIPYHRGYLLGGPPGTGKTSVARAMAQRHNMDVYYIPLGDLDSDVSLMSLIGEVEPGSMLLLEDIDVFNPTRDRSDTDTEAEHEVGGVSLSGLLNALDGIFTPHGLVVVMTSNYPERLDGALVRAGRVDRVESIGLHGFHEISRLFTRFYGEPMYLDPIQVEMVPAEAVEVFKRNLGNPVAARNDIDLLMRESLPQEATR